MTENRRTDFVSDFQDWLLQSGSAWNLGFVRFLFFACILGLYGAAPVSQWSTVPATFYQAISFFRFLPAPVGQQVLLQVLSLVWYFSVCLSMVGLFTRTATICSAILGVYLLGLPLNYGYMHHHENPIVLMMVVFACSKCGDSFSIDNLVRTHLKKLSLRCDIACSYGWPIRLTWLIYCLFYFGAGVSKLTYSGFQWATSGVVGDLILISTTTNPRQLFIPQSLMDAHSWIYSVGAGAALLFELSAPLLLVWPAWRFICLPSLIMMHFSLEYFVGFSFPQYILCVMFWIPWNRLRHARNSGEPPVHIVSGSGNA